MATICAKSGFIRGIPVKLYGRLERGINSEIEIGRFLTETAGYQNARALLGWIELVEDGVTTPIGVVHQFVENQGDAWSLTAAYLDRFLDEQKVLVSENATESPEHAAYLPRMQQIVPCRVPRRHRGRRAVAGAGNGRRPPARILQARKAGL
jgi:predicted trehalose synthase